MRYLIGGLIAAIAAYVSAGGTVTPDSLLYLEAAETFPVYLPSYHRFPPLYPAFLALFGGNPTYLNGALIIVLTGTVAWIFRSSSLRVWILAVGVAALARPIQFLYGAAWSEGLFVVLTLWFLVAWAKYLAERHTWLLWTASALLAACVMTRHAGVVLYAVCFVTLLRERRIKEFAAVSAVPLLAQVTWLVRNKLVSGVVDQRELDFKLVDLTTALTDIMLSLGSWVVPHIHGGGILALLAAGALCLVAWGLIRTDRTLVSVCAWYAILYLIFITAVISLSTVTGAAGMRLYAPLFVPMWIVAVFTVQKLFTDGQPFARKAVEYFVLIWGLSWVTAPNALNELVLAIV